MARLARVVVPGLPHHVTQRGNRRQPIFFEPGDQELYIDLLAESCRKLGVEVWAFCLMPNHVHLIMVPETPDGLARAVGEAHRRYTGFVNTRLRETGHLFQSRFASVAMDEDHLVEAVRYVTLNPVRAGLVQRAEDWRWSSAAAHLAGQDDRLTRVAPVLGRVADMAGLFEAPPAAGAFDALRKGETTGRPLGDAQFLARIEALLGRPLAPRRPGRRPRTAAET